MPYLFYGPLKQSTAITVPFFVGVGGITDANWTTKRISKGGGAFGALTVTITEMENGWYSLPLSASHTDTLGMLSLMLVSAGANAQLQFRVYARLLDDLMFPNVSGRGVDVDATGGVEITANQAVNVNAWAGSAASVNDVAIQQGTTYIAVIVNSVWDELLSEARVAGSFGQKLKDLSVTAGTGLVDITQTAADKVWASATRTLTAFSTALALSVWDVLEASIVTANSIGVKVKAMAGLVWDELRSAHVTPGTFGEGVANVIGNVAGDIGGRIIGSSVTPFAGVAAQADVRQWVGVTPNALTAGRVEALATLAHVQGVEKNVALAKFPFVMFDANGDPATGLTVSAQRSLDGGAFAATANAPVEIGSGAYAIDLAASDLNGDTVIVKFEAPGAKATLVSIKTVLP